MVSKWRMRTCWHQRKDPESFCFLESLKLLESIIYSVPINGASLTAAVLYSNAVLILLRSPQMMLLLLVLDFEESNLPSFPREQRMSGHARVGLILLLDDSSFY